MKQVVTNKVTGELEPSPAQRVFDSLWNFRKAHPELSEEELKMLESAGHMVNAQEVLLYQSVLACKRAGFVYDESQREGEEWQAFMWLQDKGLAAMKEGQCSDTAFVEGLSSKLTDIFKYIQEHNNAGGRLLKIG